MSARSLYVTIVSYCVWTEVIRQNHKLSLYYMFCVCLIIVNSFDSWPIYFLVIELFTGRTCSLINSLSAV